jgi:hypothetical protein
MLFIGVKITARTTGQRLPLFLQHHKWLPVTSTSTSEIAEAGGITGITIDNPTDINTQIETNMYFSTTVNQTCNDYFGNSQAAGECAISLNQKFH